MSCAIRVEGLQKSYAGRAVLKGLTFTVEQGEIFALLGVNGAGKTTALECIEGLRRQDGGSAVAVSYTHLDVYKRQTRKRRWTPQR